MSWNIIKRESGTGLVPSGPRGGKRKARYPIFTGSKAEFEAMLRRGKENGLAPSMLFEIFPDPEYYDKWRNLDKPERGGYASRKPGFRLRLIWHTKCLPSLEILKSIFRSRLTEPIPVDEIITKFQEKKTWKRNAVVGVLNQLWKGGQIRKLVRHNAYQLNPDGTRVGGATGGIHYGVHYLFQPYSEKDITTWHR